MTLGSTTVLALKALKRNPTRALLTALGIIIGIAAVITMMEIGNGSSTSIRNSIEKMGANTILIIPGAPRQAGVSLGAGSQMSLTPEDVTAIGRDCLAVGNVVPIVNARSSNLQLIYQNQNWVPGELVGTAPEYLDIRNWTVVEGRAFTAREVASRAAVCLVGQTIVREVFGGASPVDSRIRLNNSNFTVIGVLGEKGANMMGHDEDDVVIAPWTTIRMRITGLKTGTATNTTSTASTLPGDLYPAEGVAFYPEQAENLETDTLLIPKFTQVDQILLSAVSPEQVDTAVDEVTALLRERHRIKPGEVDDFRIRNSAEFMSMLSGTSTLMSNLLLGVALLALVVGGVGIMNIMLVSVTERTREIGLRMAVGARSRDILQQFLVEAIILCLSGGVIGILVGHGAGLLIESQLGWPIESSPTAVVAAVTVSAGVGILFGFYPAWKASKLDPIEALRYE